MTVKDTRAVSAPRYVLLAHELISEAGTAFARALNETGVVETSVYNFMTGKLRVVSTDKDLLDKTATLIRHSDSSGCTSVAVTELKETKIHG